MRNADTVTFAGCFGTDAKIRLGATNETLFFFCETCNLISLALKTQITHSD